MSYLGYDVLSVRHNAREQIAESFGRAGELLGDKGTGARWFDDFAGAPLPARSFQWTCDGRTQIAAFRTFRAARLGRLVPFWTPTYCWDMRLATDALLGAGSLTVRAAGYPARLFPNPARRYLAIFDLGQGPALCKVTAAAAIDSSSDLVSIDTPLPFALSAATAVICFLALCRLADDAVETTWKSPTLCESKIQFVELPLEVPA